MLLFERRLVNNKWEKLYIRVTYDESLSRKDIPNIRKYFGTDFYWFLLRDLCWTQVEKSVLVCLFPFVGIGRGRGFAMISEFERLRQLCRTEHHCSHYSTVLREFDVVNELGEHSAEVEKALGEHPFGDWPRINRCYSRTCPAALTWF